MGGSHANNDYVADINVTPFVDVMLVLLIILMVTAPAIASGMDVRLPSAKASVAMEPKKDELTLTITRDGELFLNEQAMSMEDLAQALVAENAQEKRLLLKADEAVPYGVVIKVMGEAKASGIQNVGMLSTLVRSEVQ